HTLAPRVATMSQIRFIAPVLHVTGRRHHHRIIKAHARHWMILKCSESDASMCDYSLDLVASRPAKVGDKLVKREGRRIPCRRKCPARDQSGHGQVTNRPEAIPMRSLKSAPSDRTSRLARSA